MSLRVLKVRVVSYTKSLACLNLLKKGHEQISEIRVTRICPQDPTSVTRIQLNVGILVITCMDLSGKCLN